MQLDSLFSRSQSNNAKLPKPVDSVNDLEQLFSIAEMVCLKKLIGQYNRMLGIKISVVSLNEDYTTTENFDAYSLKIAYRWGFADPESKDVLFCISRSLNMVRINTGYGLERILSDEETAEIIQNVIIPNYKLGNYFEGTTAGINQIMVIMHLNKK